MNRPASFDELYKGRFLKAGLLKSRPVTLTIQDVWLEELDGEKGVEEKAIVSFEKTPMQLVLCKLNGTCMKAMFGQFLSEWKGKRVTLWPTDTIAPLKKGEPCIRVLGSHDIQEDIEVPFKMPKRKAFTIRLQAMKDQREPAAPATTEPQD